jgi:hypothetical protein
MYRAYWADAVADRPRIENRISPGEHIRADDARHGAANWTDDIENNHGNIGQNEVIDGVIGVILGENGELIEEEAWDVEERAA